MTALLRRSVYHARKRLLRVASFIRHRSRNSRQVDFIVAGTQKGGTTALSHYLIRDPAICMAGIKETHFFDSDELFGQAPDYRGYHRYLAPRHFEWN